MHPVTLFAQLGTNGQTERKVALLIAALLVVAFLLAAMTVWYWRHTDPKRRVGSATTNGGPTRASSQDLLAGPGRLSDLSIDNDGSLINRTVEPGSAQDGLTLEGMSVDEWLSLTGPEALPKNP